MRKQIIRGTAANGIGQIVIIAVQLISIPILASHWGAGQLGVWILLYSIPSYLAMGDFGLASSAGNEMVMLIAKKKVPQARETYHSAWTGVTVCCATITVTGICYSLYAPAEYLPSNLYLDARAARLAISLLAAYSAMCLQNSIQMAGYRCIGQYPRGTLINALTMLFESSATVGVVLLGGSIPTVAASILIVRTICVCASAYELYRLEDWLKPGFSAASMTQVRRLLHLGTLTMLIPAAYALNLQGTLLVIGSVLGPSQVTVFAVTRTLTRTGIQASALVNHAIMPEFSVAAARGDHAAMKRMFSLNLLAYAVMLLAAAAGLILFGQTIIAEWTRGAAQPDRLLVTLAAAAMLLQGIWHGTSNLLLAVNKQGRFAPHFLFISIGTLCLCYVGCGVLGLHGAALAVCTGEAAMIVPVFRSALDLGVGSIAEAIISLPRTALDCLAFAREIRFDRNRTK